MNGRVGVLGLLGVAFVVLKLCGVIAWSWWWVLLPFYGSLLVFAAVFLFVFACGTLIAAGKALQA